MAGIPTDYFKYGLLAGLGLGAIVEHNNISLAYHTLGRDVRSIMRFGRIIMEYRKIQKHNKTVPQYFWETVQKCQDKPMIICAETDEVWTFGEVNNLSNKLANLLLDRGFARGDVVAIFMENNPQYMVVLMALAKIGVTAALINHHLTHDALSHCINIAKCRACIYDHNLEQALAAVAPNLVPDASNHVPFQFFCINNHKGFPDTIGGVFSLDQNLSAYPDTPVPRDIRKSINWNDELCYIYTSGTTGLPKAACGDHGRYILASLISIVAAGIQETDRLYTGLPLYHSSGQWFAMGSAVIGGCTVILRKGFSAKNFWPDCVKYEATIAQYIGEICRFLLARPKCPEETQHKLRMVYGVGMRPKIWNEFVKRFNIPKVVELYGSTEGTVGLINAENKVGAVGFVSRLFPIMPVGLIKLDNEGEPVRDPKTGMCVRCQPGEEGEVIGTVRPDDRGGPKQFQAYVNNKEGTSKKLIHDVWKKGDVGFRSGDILVMDDHGWLYFRDRTGDTFRWRGENVSTTEVESIVGNLSQHREAVCYGVEVPGAEGKAGMVAILDPENTLDLGQLAAGIRAKLPKYARPVFIRLINQLKLTGTYKLVKKELQTEGYDVTKVSDPVYFMGPDDKQYKLLDPHLYQQIQDDSSRAKL